MYRSISAVLLIALLAACNTVGNTINPYKSNFNCPYKESGRCISMTGAYDESRGQKMQPMDPANAAHPHERREGLPGECLQEALRSPR